jgi:hypothetical protein
MGKAFLTFSFLLQSSRIYLEYTRALISARVTPMSDNCLSERVCSV